MTISSIEALYTVVGKWPFPATMLRRHNARPVSEFDALSIERLSESSMPDDSEILVSINIIADLKFRPMTERWESFRWPAPEDVARATVEDRGAMKRLAALKKSAYAKLTPEEIDAVEVILDVRAFH